MGKSLIEIAYEIQSERKEPIQFEELWGLVKEAASLDEEIARNKVARFYTNLMLDGRFVNLGDNEWDLRARHTFDKTHHDMNDVYSDVESEDEDEEEDEENKEYNKILEGGEPSESLSDNEDKEEEENF